MIEAKKKKNIYIYDYLMYIVYCCTASDQAKTCRKLLRISMVYCTAIAFSATNRKRSLNATLSLVGEDLQSKIAILLLFLRRRLAAGPGRNKLHHHHH
jgi:hypothetical protein